MAWSSLTHIVCGAAFITTCFSISDAGPAAAAGLAARAAIAHASGPTPTLKPMEKRQQTIFNFCPEQIGEQKRSCDAEACGGDAQVAGFCDKLLVTGPQDGCIPPGCGVHCQCTPTDGEQPLPTDQVPFQVCPEALGQPKKKCSDCGGDSKDSGVCNDILLNGNQGGCPPGGCGYRCQCDDGSGTQSMPPQGSPTHLVTSVVNGETVTATFQATTLSEWKDLKSHTTITTSVSSTETEAAIAIFAGGVAWWLLGQSGAAAAVLSPPLEAPEGSEEDDQSCSPEPKCDDADCGGANSLGLCKSGDKANCPCEDEKQECPEEPPKCAAPECNGDDSNLKCQADGKLKDCQCCPNEQPQCNDEDCTGKDGKCDAEKLKGCACGENIMGPAPLPQPVRNPPSQSQIDDTAWEILQSLFDGDQSILEGGSGDDSGEGRDHPSGKPTCSDNAASGVPEHLVTDVGDKSPNELQYMMREVLCNDKCEMPDGISQDSAAATPDGDGCELALILPNEVEAYSYRGTHAQGPQRQDCWDSLANITETCIKNGPNTGWVNGPDEYEFFQAGFRPLNGDGAKHGQLDGSKALKDANDNMPADPQPSTDPDCPEVPPCPPGKGCPDPKPCDQLSCDVDCCGTIPNPQWCNNHCGGTVC